jgi:hypothetical protein
VKVKVLTAVIAVSLLSIAWSTRAFLPLAGRYTTRLRILQGWTTVGQYGFNCSGYLVRAHGDHFMNEREMYAGDGDLAIVYALPNRAAIDESKLLPGDIAAFRGLYPQAEGVHVAAFLSPGVWVDADVRRGGPSATYRLQDKPVTDEWFQGEVHILRWKTAPHSTFDFTLFGDDVRSIRRDK